MDTENSLEYQFRASLCAAKSIMARHGYVCHKRAVLFVFWILVCGASFGIGYLFCLLATLIAK